VLAAVGDQLTPGFAAQLLQQVQLLIQSLGATPQPAFAQLRHILAAVLAVQLLARAPNRLAPEHRLQPAHHPRRVFGQRLVAARQVLHLKAALLAVIDR
jgi:hypothetical protein